MDFHLEENYEMLLADRKFCPSYNYCYHIYREELKKKYGPLEFDKTGKEFLQKRLSKFNKSTTCNNSTNILFHESDYIICICPPLLRRVHQYVGAASELVFIDSSVSVAGYLLIVTSSESEKVLTLGLELFKSMVGEIAFGGNVNGPKIFLTDDSVSERTAISNVWKNSKCLLCTFHVLQSVWRWIMESKNGITQDTRPLLFHQFGSIVYAKTATECEEMYNLAKVGASNNPNYLKYLEEYWSRKELWALCFRNNLLTRGNNTKNYSEAAMRVLKDKIFERVKAFNTTQMVDFLLTKFVSYYERRLLDAAHNRLRKNILHNVIKIPPPGLLERIQIVADNIILVPSESVVGLHYIVNTEVLMCTCFQSKICKHIDWACFLVQNEKYNLTIDNEYIRKNFYVIAIGVNPPQDWLNPLYGRVTKSAVASPNFHLSTERKITKSLIINNENNLNENDHITDEVTLKRGEKVIEKISSKMITYLNNGVDEVLPALELFCERLSKIKTNAAFVSSLSSFATEYQRRNHLKRIPVQPTAISRRTTALSGKNCHIGGRPRKSTAIMKVKNSHHLSKRIKKNISPN